MHKSWWLMQIQGRKLHIITLFIIHVNCRLSFKSTDNKQLFIQEASSWKKILKIQLQSFVQWQRALCTFTKTSQNCCWSFYFASVLEIARHYTHHWNVWFLFLGDTDGQIRYISCICSGLITAKVCCCSYLCLSWEHAIQLCFKMDLSCMKIFLCIVGSWGLAFFFPE